MPEPIAPNAQGLFLADNESTDENLDTEAAEEVAAVPGAAEAAAIEGQGGSEPASAAEVKPKEDAFAPRFAALTRKEKELRQMEKRIKAAQAELEAKSKQTPAEPAKEPIEMRLKKNPFETLKELGIPYETLTDMALNEGKPTADLQMRLMREEIERGFQSKIEALETQLKAKAEQEEQEKQNTTLRNFKSSIQAAIEANKDAYELLSVEGEQGLDSVVEVINNHYNETEEIMSISDALTVVEEQLLGEAKKRIELGKIKKLLTPSPGKPSEIKPKSPTKSSSVTLSNQTTQVQPTSGRFLSDEESKREAAKLIKFNS